MSKHAMNLSELKARITTLRNMRNNLRNAVTGHMEKQHFIDIRTARVSAELQDVRSVYYARVQDARIQERQRNLIEGLLEPLGWEATENYRQNMAGL